MAENEEEKQTEQNNTAEITPSEVCECECSGEVERLTQENQSLSDQFKRAIADYRNLEARTDKEKTSYLRYAQGEIIKAFLPVIDNLEKASAAMDEKGIQLITDQCRKILDTYQVREIKALGTAFNPQLHDCIDIGEGENDTVIEVLEKGYLMDDKVLRPAKVKVGKSKTNTEKKSDGTSRNTES